MASPAVKRRRHCGRFAREKTCTIQFNLGGLDWLENPTVDFYFIVSCLIYIIVNLLDLSDWEVVSVNYFQSGPAGVCHIAGAWSGRIRSHYVSNSSNSHRLGMS